MMTGRMMLVAALGLVAMAAGAPAQPHERFEALGEALFFSQQFTNCNMCDQLRRSAIDPRETFTNNNITISARR